MPLIVALAGIPSASAATRVWDGGGATNAWSEAANWSGDVVPGVNDVATFDGTSTKDATIDANGPQGANINLGILLIKPGYTGTIAQEPSVNVRLTVDFNQGEPLSTFIGGSGDLDVDQNFFLTGGTFISPSGRLLVGASFSHTAGGTFLHNNGTVVFDTFFGNLGVPGSETFNNLTFNAVNQNKTIANGGTLIVLGTLTLADGSITAGVIEARGALTHQTSFDGGNTIIRVVQETTRTITLAAPSNFPNLVVNAPNVTINTSGAGTISMLDLTLQAGTVQQGSVALNLVSLSDFIQSGGTYIGGSGALTTRDFVLAGGTFTGGSGDIDVNQFFTISGGTFTSTSGRLLVAHNFTHTAGGTFLHNNGTVVFDNAASAINVNTSETFNNVTFNFSPILGSKTIAAGDTLIVLGTLTLADGAVDGGTVEAHGDLVHGLGFDGGNTVIRVVDPAPRTISLSGGGRFPNLTLDAPDVTINTAGTGTLTLLNLNLVTGTFQQGSVALNLASLSDFTQSGGTYNGGSGALNVNDRFVLSGGNFNHDSGLITAQEMQIAGGVFAGGSGDIDLNLGFTLSGGTFTAPGGRLFVGQNFTHTAGGSFLHHNGTVVFDNFSDSTINVNGSETFHNLTFNVVNGSKNIAAGDTLVSLGSLTLTNGAVNTGTLSPQGNMTVGGGAIGGNARVTFAGSDNQTYTNAAGRPNLSGVWTVLKPAGKVTLASNLALATTQALNITSGTLDLGSSFNLTAGPITVGAGGTLRNFGNGNLTLGGSLVNNGIFNFNGGGTGCGDANASDQVLIRSSLIGSTRTWSGTGAFSVVDVDLQDQNASAVSGGIRAFTSTNSGNNPNWIFDTGCPVRITAQPADQSGCLNAATSLIVGATGDTLTFRWRKNGVDLADGGNVSGATTATLTINPTTAGDVGSYDVVAADRFGVTATSTSATLTLLALPEIISQPVSATSCETEPVTFTVGATGDGLTYQWRKDGNPIAGANASSFSILSVAAADAGDYDVVVGGTCGPPAISSAVALTVNTAPVITSQPVNQEVPGGSTASFSVTATGTDLTFQWRRNGIPLSDDARISGANSATLTIDAVAAEDAASYDVVVGGTCSPTATSDPATLTVIVCTSAEHITFECMAGVTAMSSLGETPVPLDARLSTELQMSHGVTFGSIAGYVALVRLGSGHATSPPNGIGGVDASDRLEYDAPIVITFTMPGSTSTPAVTDFISIRGDQIAAAGSATMEAFDVSGALIGSVTAADVTGGLTLSLSIPNIHSVRLTQTQQSDIAFDDLTFHPLAPGLSARPTANAGPDQPAHAGETVTLDGSGSSDDNTATGDLLFAWTLISKPAGSSAALAGAATMHPSFVSDVPGEYVASLVVTDADGQSSDPDTVAVSSLNCTPAADAGADQGGFVGQLVTLDGSASHDPDSDPLEFSWTLVGPDGNPAALAGAMTPSPTFIPSIDGTYTATLTVTDPFGAASSDTTVISVISAGEFAMSQIVSALNDVGALTAAQVTTRGNRQALQNFLSQAIAALQAGDVLEARNKLLQAIERTDGCVLRGRPDENGPGRDWVIDCTAQSTIYQKLNAALNALS